MSEQEMVKIAMRANGIEKPDRSLILGLPKIGEKYSKNRLRTPPTYPQSELTFILDDYGKKGSITFRFSGGDTPSAGTGY